MVQAAEADDLMFYAVIYDRDSWEPVPTQAQLTLAPVRWSARAVGGFEAAEITVRGQAVGLWEALRWLRCGVEIRNELDSVVWAGYVHQAEVVADGIKVASTLDEMANRVQVLYSWETVDGANVSGTTDWAEEPGSMGRFGTKELRHSASDVSPAAADALRDLILATRQFAVPAFELAAGEEAMATLVCRGWFETLGWRYYANALGRNDSTTTGEYQALGLGFTSTKVAFTKAKVIAVHAVGGELEYFDAGQKVVVNGSTSNDGTYEIKEADNKPGTSYASTTLSCEPADDIFDDVGKGLNFIGTNDMILVSGFPTAANNRDYLIETTGDDAIETHNTYGEISAVDSAGASVTIERGNKVEVLGTMTNEQLGDTVTVTQHGVKIAQYVTNGTGSAWTIDRVGIEICHVGEPSDDVTVALYSNDSGTPGTLLASGTIDADDVGDKMAWLWADFGNTYTFATGTGYWIVVSRVGENDWDDFYRIGIDEDTAYTGGHYLLWDGSSWAQRPVAARLGYAIWGAVDIATQAATIAAAKGPFFTDVNVADTAGIETNQYRDGTATAQDEITDLLAIGDSGGGRMACRVTPDRELIIEAAGAYDETTAMIYRRDGTLRHAMGGRLEAGRLIAGTWMEIEGLPASVDALAPVSPVFIEADEFEISSGQNRPRPQAARDPWDVVQVRQG